MNTKRAVFFAMTIWAAGFLVPAMAQSPDAALNAEVVMKGKLAAGQKNGFMLRIKHTDGGFPLFAEELEFVHESPIHVLLINPALSDYHHVHPVRGENEGEQVMFINPRTPCGYKGWAQVHLKGGKEEVVRFNLPGVKDCSAEKAVRDMDGLTEVDGYSFKLKADKDILRKGKDVMLTLSITDSEGKGVEDLQGVMGAFAHLVGFYDDYDSIAHIHPMGDEPSGVHDRGGPDLQFHYRPEKSGPVRLYAQVKIDDKMIFAPFDVSVGE